MTTMSENKLTSDDEIVPVPSEEGFIPVPGGTVWYGVYGRGREGVPLLVLHGGPGFLSLPREVADLADERPVIFYDQFIPLACQWLIPSG
jgi:hypothetical protein